MEPLGLVAGIIEIGSATTSVLNALTPWKKDPKVAAAYSRVQWSTMLLELFVSYEQGSFNFKSEFVAKAEVHEHLYEASTEMQKIKVELSKISRLSESKYASIKLQIDKDRILGNLIAVADRVERLAKYMQDLHQMLTLQRLGDRITTLLERSDLFPKETWQTVHSIEKRLADGGHVEEEIAKTRDELEQQYPSLSPDERESKLQVIRSLLCSRLDSRPQGQDPMSFPFTIPCQDVDDVQVRVKLDTGSRPNWISKRVLDQAGLIYEAAENLGHFIGAGQDPSPFTPLGQVLVTWFSENQALTTTSTFFVHDDNLPFDVVLGSKWIIEDLSFRKFMEPVLPMRHILNNDQLKEIEARAIEDGHENEQLIQIQKLQERQERDQKRQAKANSRMTSVAPTPRPLGPPYANAGSVALTRRTSIASIGQTIVSPAQAVPSSSSALQVTEQPETEHSSATVSSSTSARNFPLNN